MSRLLRNNRIFSSKETDLISDGSGTSLVTSDEKIKSLIAGTGISLTDSGTEITITNTSTFSGYTSVANYSALPAAGLHNTETYEVLASQGTAWLPGSLGGTYYSAGFYYSNGVSWSYLGSAPYQATQSDVNAGTITDQFVSPNTLNNYSGWTKTKVGLSNVENTALSTWAGSTNLITLGTITTGTWNSSLITGTYGGTGVNNGTRTITIAGNLTTTGAFNTTFVQQFSGNTTLPPSATILAGSASALTSGRIPFVTTNGLLLDDNALNWDNTSKLLKVGTGTFVGADIEVSKTSSAAGSTAIGVFNSTTDGNSSLNAGESNTNKAQLVFFNTAATGNYVSSITNVSLSVFRSRIANIVGAGAVMLNGTPIYGIVGTTTTNSGFRQDATGLRIDATSTLNTSNTHTFQVTGNIGLRYNAKTANYTASTDFLIDCTSNSFTITLPTAVSISGRMYIIKNSNSGTTITIATTSAQTIDGAAPGTIVGIGVIRVMSNGANWITW